MKRTKNILKPPPNGDLNICPMCLSAGAIVKLTNHSLCEYHDRVDIAYGDVDPLKPVPAVLGPVPAVVKLTPVLRSSNVSAVAYDFGRRLFVRFNGGTVYCYEGVEPDVYVALMRAPSKGSFLAQRVTRNAQYPARKLPPEEAALLG